MFVDRRSSFTICLSTVCLFFETFLHAASQRVSGLRVMDVGVDYVSVTWRDIAFPPSAISDGSSHATITYEARCVRASDAAARSTPDTGSIMASSQSPSSSSTVTVTTGRTNVTFVNLLMNTEYLVSVRFVNLIRRLNPWMIYCLFAGRVTLSLTDTFRISRH